MHYLSRSSASRDSEKLDDLGWKAKLKIPPKDRRIKTSVSVWKKLPVYYFFVAVQRAGN